ncbi:MAG: MAPEG family protein [Cocleimonas sp.]|nr:MAPEG family protein [Cocleimonas sp.]
MSLQAALLLPMIGMIFLTFGVMLWMLKLRYRAVLQDGLNPQYFRLYKGAKLPDYLAKVTQHYDNLLEMPIFFYVAILLLIVLKNIDPFYVALSWAFFLTRLLHSYIHTTNNKLMHRKNVFIVSTLVLMVLWVRICIDVLPL